MDNTHILGEELMKTILEVDPLIRIEKSKLLEPPVLIRVTKFDDESAKNFSDSMSDAHCTGQQIVPVVIDSPGGYVYSLLSMISDIQNSKLPVATIAVGKAMSCGSILLSCGTEGYRYADRNSHIMIHDVAAMFGGKNEEVKASAKHMDNLQKQIFRLMAKNCGHDDQDYFLKIIHEKSHAEWYLTPNEAKRHKVINHVKVPEMITTVKVETTFG